MGSLRLEFKLQEALSEPPDIAVGLVQKLLTAKKLQSLDESIQFDLISEGK
jgi:hypothetical protein